VNIELSYVDSVLNYLFASLHKGGWLDCINLVILSDHGMQRLDTRLYLNELLPDIEGLVITPGVVSRVYVKEGSNKTADWILKGLNQRDNSKFRVYDRKHVPKRYHYAKSATIGDVVFEGLPGTVFFP
jgi:predicted AlkP superfamily pyrophosphatase or phosphodiesterase